MLALGGQGQLEPSKAQTPSLAYVPERFQRRTMKEQHGEQGFHIFQFSNKTLSQQKSSSNPKKTKKEKSPTRKANQVIDSRIMTWNQKFLFSLASLAVLHGDANGCRRLVSDEGCPEHRVGNIRPQSTFLLSLQQHLIR